MLTSGLLIALVVVALSRLPVELTVIRIPWLTGTFTALGAIATSIVAFLAWQGNRAALRSIQKSQQVDAMRSRHSVFQMERCAIQLLTDIAAAVEEGREYGRKMGLPEEAYGPVPVYLSQTTVGAIKAFLDVFQALGMNMLDELRFLEVRATAAQLAMLLKPSAKPRPKLEQLESAYNCLIEMIHVEEKAPEA